jgi:hypothetical protein
MQGNIKKFLLKLAILFLFAFSTNTFAVHIEYKPEELEKPAIKFEKGDLESTFGGSIKVNYFLCDAAYLNDNIPDQYSGVIFQIDPYAQIIYGQKKFGHKAFEAYIALRMREKWGTSGFYARSTKTDVSLDGISLGSHRHYPGRPYLWVNNAWGQFSFNSAFGLNIDTLHFMKAGIFSYELGKGIALGDSYSTVKEDYGIYTYFGYSNAPGIEFHGDILKGKGEGDEGKLSYSLYYSKFEDQSATLADTFNTIKKNHVGRRANPWRGWAKDEDVFAAKLRWTPVHRKKFGHLELEPFIYYDEDSDEDLNGGKNNSKVRLGAYGLSFDYNTYNEKFEMCGEVAFNYGSENMYALDNNKKTTQLNEITGTLEVVYNKIHLEAVDGTLAPVTPTNTNLINQYKGSENSVNFARELYNDASRFSPAYKNDLRGWMGVIAAAYNFQDWNLKLATEYGYASGDSDRFLEEKNKTYNGFIGLHEVYWGMKVISVLLFGEREIARPVSLKPGAGENFEHRTNTNFSDIQYFGLSATWKPERLKKRDFLFKPNLLFFWKNEDSYKFDLSTHTVSETEKASSFYGTEFNIMTKFDLIKDVTFAANLAVFFPGSYFDDVKGVKVDYGDVYSNLDSVTQGNVKSEDYRLSNEIGVFADISLKYKF